jgi:hypothetical protein
MAPLPHPLRSLLADAARPGRGGLHRIAVAQGAQLPAPSPAEWCSHGVGAGQLDGLEEWGQAWGRYYLSVTRSGGGGGFRWALCRRDDYPRPAAWGESETAEEAGATVRRICQLLRQAELPGPGGLPRGRSPHAA